jgi:hypothetical protein
VKHGGTRDMATKKTLNLQVGNHGSDFEKIPGSHDGLDNIAPEFSIPYYKRLFSG